MKKKFAECNQLYSEAIQAEADCTDAMYNLGLSQMRLKEFDLAKATFERLLAILPDNPDALFQIATILDLQGANAGARDIFKRLQGVVPTDPGVLAKLGALYNKEGDESQAYYYYELSFRHYPVNMDVISWLGAYYVKTAMYEKAISFFERAGQIEPDEVKWQLMIASCHRRGKNAQKAMLKYKDIDRKFPDNVECLKYVIQCAEELNLDVEVWKDKLNKALKKQQTDRDQARDSFDTLPVVENRPPEQNNFSAGGGGMGMGSMGMQQRPPPQAPMAPQQRGPVEIGDMSVAQKQKGKSIASLGGGGGGKDDLDFSGDELDDDLLPGM
jgi:intraflagellar transport protein 88